MGGGSSLLLESTGLTGPSRKHLGPPQPEVYCIVAIPLSARHLRKRLRESNPVNPCYCLSKRHMKKFKRQGRSQGDPLTLKGRNLCTAMGLKAAVGQGPPEDQE